MADRFLYVDNFSGYCSGAYQSFANRKERVSFFKMILFGFVPGLWLAKLHPGHLAIFLIPMAICSLVTMPWRNIRVWFSLLGSCIIALLMATDTHWVVYKDSLSFSKELDRGAQQGYKLFIHLWSLMNPLTVPTANRFVSDWHEWFRNRFSRGPFLGAPFTLTAFGSVLWTNFDRNRARAAVGLACIAALVLSLADSALSKTFSGMRIARDPFVLFGIMTAPMAFSAILKTRSLLSKRFVYFCLLARFCKFLSLLSRSFFI